MPTIYYTVFFNTNNFSIDLIENSCLVIKKKKKKTRAIYKSFEYRFLTYLYITRAISKSTSSDVLRFTTHGHSGDMFPHIATHTIFSCITKTWTHRTCANTYVILSDVRLLDGLERSAINSTRRPVIYFGFSRTLFLFYSFWTNILLY